MDRQIENVIKELQEISEVLDHFNSEKVQLKIIEALLPLLTQKRKRRDASRGNGTDSDNDDFNTRA